MMAARKLTPQALAAAKLLAEGDLYMFDNCWSRSRDARQRIANPTINSLVRRGVAKTQNGIIPKATLTDTARREIAEGRLR